MKHIFTLLITLAMAACVSAQTPAAGEFGLSKKNAGAGYTLVPGPSTADSFWYFDASGVLQNAPLSSYIRSLLDDADATVARATLGVSIGSDVQAYSADLALAAQSSPGANLVFGTDGSGVKGWQAGGSGAPTTATYITQTANGTLSNEQALSALSTGLMQVTTTTGVVSSVTTSAGISGLLSDETGSGALAFATSPVFTTRITLPNAAAPSTTTVGQMALDNNALAASRGAVQIHDGTANTFLVGTSAAPSTTGHVPIYMGSGVVTYGKVGFVESYQQSNGGSQSLTNSEVDLDPSGGVFPFIMEDVAVAGRKMLVMVTVTLKFNAVTFSSSDSVTLSVKTGGGTGVTTFNYQPGDLTLYSSPPIQLQIPVVFTVGSGTLSLKVTGGMSNPAGSGSIDVVNIDSIVLIHSL